MAKLKPAVHEGDRGTGNKNANIILVEFGDYQCPHCGHAYPLLKRLVREMKDQFYFVFRNFPLQEIHPAAMMAAQAAEAAAQQNKFWEMHDVIFEHQDNLQGNRFLHFAEELRLDLNEFAKDWKSTEILEKIETDFESGVRSGVNGTPTFFVNGEILLSYDGSYESLVEGIRIFAE
jgi:protein-disulfide isomerase